MVAPRHSIKTKLTRLVLLTILAVLGLSGTMLLTVEIIIYRHTAAQHLDALADVLGEVSGGLMAEQDRHLARDMLAGLGRDREILDATLFDRSGRVFTTYQSSPEIRGLNAIPGPEGVHLGLHRITVVKPVSRSGVASGTLVLRGNLSGTYQRLLAYALLLVGVVAVSSATALTISRLLQRRITEPLHELARAARLVSTERDFSARARRTSDDELGELTDAFNTMLDQIVLGNAALRQSEERFRTLADNIAQVAWMADASGTQLWFNRRWEQFVGKEKPSRPREFFNERLHPEHREHVLGTWRAALATGRPWEGSFPLRDRHGSFRWFLCHAIPIRDNSGQVVHWFGTNTDITELREVQHQLRESRDQALAASRAKDDFLAQLSHELRTPLNPVLLMVSDTHRLLSMPEEVRADFADIRRHVELEARLIDDLLDLTAITHGKLKLTKAGIDIHDVLADALATVRTEIEAKQIKLVVETAPEPAPALADAARLQQVFWNILRNATKFTPHGGRIHVATSVETGSRRFLAVIRDTGLGMTADEIARAFAPFAQGNHTDPRGSRRFGGLGLGLAISRRLIERHDGSIEVTSEGRDRGTTVTVRLPLADAPSVRAETRAGPAVSPGAPAAESGGGRPCVLLVEDHEPTLAALRQLLARRGYEVVTAASVSEARVAAARHRIALLVSDIGLPDGSGHDLMVELRGNTAGRLQGIAITGYGMEEDVARAHASGFVTHLTKPITVAALDTALARAAGTSLPTRSVPGPGGEAAPTQPPDHR